MVLTNITSCKSHGNSNIKILPNRTLLVVAKFTQRVINSKAVMNPFSSYAVIN